MRKASVVSSMAVALGLASAPGAAGAPEGIHKIQHVVMIMQENRSFDSYFGTYPGANGTPAGVCEPDPLNGGCIAPFHNPGEVNSGGPHGSEAALADIHGGRMDGFVGQAEKGLKCSSTEPGCSPCATSEVGAGGGNCVDVMGYHDAREIPNYWTYAKNYVLQDNLYESSLSWSLPEHLFLVSGWSAACPDGDANPLDCKSAPELVHPETHPNVTYAWTNLTYLMYRSGVSWRYYMFEGNEPDCVSDEAMTCDPVHQSYKTPGIWNPLVDFTNVKEDGQRGNIQSINNFYTAVQGKSVCGLPNVAWIAPNSNVSEHPPALISVGQAYVTTMINTIMRSPCWSSTAIFVSWDDWGGFYDHVVPPSIDKNGYGLRVPGLVISPYARAGYVDHQQLSHDAYLKFIEDDFLSGQRLNPTTDGRPDLRPNVREEAPGLGNLMEEFDFNQQPRPPLILPTHPAPGPASNPPGYGPPAAPAPNPRLQLTVSLAGRQDLRSHHGRIHLTVSSNAACSLYVHGHLNLVRHRRHLGLRSKRAALAADQTLRIALSLSRSNLVAVRRALRRHRPVEATIEVEATGTSGLRQSYQVIVRLSWR